MRKRAKHTLLPEASLEAIIVALKSVRGSEGHRGSSLENKQTVLKGTKASIMVGTGAFQRDGLMRRCCRELTVWRVAVPLLLSLSLPFPLSQEQLPSLQAPGLQRLRVNPCRWGGRSGSAQVHRTLPEGPCLMPVVCPLTWAVSLGSGAVAPLIHHSLFQTAWRSRLREDNAATGFVLTSFII